MLIIESSRSRFIIPLTNFPLPAMNRHLSENIIASPRSQLPPPDPRVPFINFGDPSIRGIVGLTDKSFEGTKFGLLLYI